jgi:molybdopterin synthase catalytic subunit
MPLDFAKSHEEFSALVKDLYQPRAGAFLSFFGKVRAINGDKAVAYLTYEAHEPLACAMFADLEQIAKKQYALIDSFAIHRLGRVDIADNAVVIAVCAAHRQQAFGASQFLIDELKRTLPIWKQEVYDDHSFSLGSDYRCL